MYGEKSRYTCRANYIWFKISIFYEEFKRNRKRLVDAIDEVSTCAISGAVGTFANINPNVEKHVAKKLS